jgi:hypothetical protein
MGSIGYLPLDVSINEIRVLVLKPASSISAPVELEMRHMILGDPPGLNVEAYPAESNHFKDNLSTYYALSYTWGKEMASHPLLVNGAEVIVTKNLESALRHIRLGMHGQSLWVDALCINQEDEIEKTVQVRMMRRIYEDAFAVLIWLGEEKPQTTALAIGLLRSQKTLDLAQIKSEADLQSAILENEKEMLCSCRQPEHKPAWDALAQDLLRRDWFRRMWVIQEMALARRAYVFCGPWSIQWDKLVTATVFARRINLPAFFETDVDNGEFFLDNLHIKATYQKRRIHRGNLLLQELLCNNVGCYTTEPVDMVFSLLGLATDVDGAPELDPDYSKSVREVYTDLVKFQLRKHHSLDIICSSYHPKRQSDLPSWVPDWSNLKENVSVGLAPIEHGSYAYGRYVYNASKGPLTDYRLSEDSRTLQVLGAHVDVLSELGEVYDAWGSLRDTVKRWGVLVLGEDYEDRFRPYVCGGNMWDAFNRTITGDRTRRGHRSESGSRGLDICIEKMPEDFYQQRNLSWLEGVNLFVADITRAVQLVASRRRLFVTQRGYLGLGPPDAQIGDSVCILKGCSVPVILRKEEKPLNYEIAGIAGLIEMKSQYFRFIAESFVLGIMDGEVIDEFEIRKEELQKIILI